MFGDIRDKLGAIDLVFDESLFERGNRMDERAEIDPAKEYTAEELERFASRLFGIDARKSTGAEAKYLLIDVRLEGEGQTYEAQFLRGFDLAMFSHANIGESFLDTLKNAIGDNFGINTDWPVKGEGMYAHAVPDIVFERDGMKLTVTGIGGGRYNLRDNKLNVYGTSYDFGSIPKTHDEHLQELLGLLVQKQPFQGYKVNME